MTHTSLIVVNFESEDLTVEAVEHVAADAGAPEQILVVDNSPERGLAERLAGHGPRVDYRAAPRNLGFGGGVNLGLESVSGELVVLLNPDARPQRGCLAGLVEQLEGDPTVGIVGPALLPWDAGGPALPSATRIDPSFWSTLLEHTVLRRLGGGWLDRHYFLSADDGPAPADAAMVQGACFALRRELLAELRGFDTRFFHSWEETDFCRRARRAGWRVLYRPDLACRHLGGGSTHDPRLARRHFWNGLFAYHRKHSGRLNAGLLRWLLVPGVAAEWAVLRAIGMWRANDPRLAHDLRVTGESLVLLLSSRSPEKGTA